MSLPPDALQPVADTPSPPSRCRKLGASFFLLAALLPAAVLAAAPSDSAPAAPQPISAEAARAGMGGKQSDPQNPAAGGKSGEKRTVPVKRAKAPPVAATGKPQEATVVAEAFSASPPERGIRIFRSTGAARLEPLLTRAYQAFMAGDIDKAKTDYLTVLQQAPNNRDALLGLAAIAVNQGQTQDALTQYQRVLHLDPLDVVARTGLIVLGGDSDPGANESSLKIILAQNPDTGFVHFALGNLYARQARWPEAQEAYFKAFHLAPGNADHAYNLAVSLDHLDQPKSALAYYQRALTLRHGSFDSEQLKKRIDELQP